MPEIIPPQAAPKRARKRKHRSRRSYSRISSSFVRDLLMLGLTIAIAVIVFMVACKLYK